MGNNEMTPDSDGKYRWIYTQNLWKHPTILISTLCVLVGCALVFCIIGLFVGGIESFLGMIKVFVPASAVLALVGWFIFVLINGGRYTMLFIMDEKSVIHTLLPKQARKAETLGAAAALLGIVNGDIGAVGTGIMAASNQTFESKYEQVKSVKFTPKHDLIRIHSPFVRNQIFVSQEQYSFVAEYISSRCPALKRTV